MSRQNLIKQCDSIERQWLRSIYAPVDQIPAEVSKAVAVREIYSRLSVPTYRYFTRECQRINSEKLAGVMR